MNKIEELVNNNNSLIIRVTNQNNELVFLYNKNKGTNETYIFDKYGNMFVNRYNTLSIRFKDNTIAKTEQDLDYYIDIVSEMNNELTIKISIIDYEIYNINRKPYNLYCSINDILDLEIINPD